MRGSDTKAQVFGERTLAYPLPCVPKHMPTIKSTTKKLR